MNFMLGLVDRLLESKMTTWLIQLLRKPRDKMVNLATTSL